MEENNNIKELLSELRKISGLPLVLDSDALGNNPHATEKKLIDLISLCKNEDSRNTFFINFLSGTLSDEEIISGFAKYHVSMSYNSWCVYAIGFKTPFSNVVTEILSGLFPVSKNIIVRIDQTFIAVIRCDASEKTESDELEISNMLVDTLRSEAMTDARVGFDKPVNDFLSIQKAFQNSFSALKIASEFSLEGSSFCYRSLGLNKLLSKLPDSTIEEYMEDEFHGFSFSELSTESTNTIKTLFDNGLNIAETARALYLHRNTLVYRLEKFHKESGLDLRLFDDAVKCKMGMMMNELLNNRKSKSIISVN